MFGSDKKEIEERQRQRELNDLHNHIENVATLKSIELGNFIRQTMASIQKQNVATMAQALEELRKEAAAPMNRMREHEKAMSMLAGAIKRIETTSAGEGTRARVYVQEEAKKLKAAIAKLDGDIKDVAVTASRHTTEIDRMQEEQKEEQQEEEPMPQETPQTKAEENRRVILGAMVPSGLPFSEIVKRTGKHQSTVSNTLKKLYSLGHVRKEGALYISNISNKPV